MPDVAKEVVVVGGSLAGLMSAIVLKSLGCKVHVLERSSGDALQSQAAGVRAGPEVHTFIETYVKNAPEYAITADIFEIVDSKGDVITKFRPTAPLRLTTWKALYDMLKATFLEPTDGKEPASYETGQLVQGVRYDGAKLFVNYRDLDKDTVRSMQADFVVAADGAHSTIRSMVAEAQQFSPKYAGYVTWRGRVPEGALSPKAQEALRKRCVVHRVEGGYLISYYVPADGGISSVGKREFVWVWYDMLPEDSTDFLEAMTDTNGRKHSTTVPRGMMQPKIWRRVLEQKRATTVSNPYFIELFEKTEEPFISAIRDFPGSKGVFYDGKLFLLGDALAQCRPHAGGSTSQAAIQARGLVQIWEGTLTPEQWEKNCLESAAKAQAYSLGMGEFFFTGKAPDTVRSTVEASKLQ